MENKENPKSGWWHTAPGILTAVAALVTALGGLLLTLNQVGCFDKNAKKNIEVVQTPSENNESKQIQSESNDISSNEKTENKTSEIIQTPSENKDIKQPESNDTSKNTENKNPKKYPITLPVIADVKMGNFTIKFIETIVDNYSAEKLSLTFKIRLTNKSNNGEYFGYYPFRVLFDGQILSPEKSSFNDEYVTAISTKDGAVVFVIPNTIKSAELQISYYHDEKQTTKFPINLN